jgi:hypothetical protein
MKEAVESTLTIGLSAVRTHGELGMICKRHSWQCLLNGFEQRVSWRRSQSAFASCRHPIYLLYPFRAGWTAIYPG